MSRAVVKINDMEGDMLEFAVNQTVYAQDNYNSEQEIAKYMKTQFEDTYGPTWHCLVGRHFSSYVTHEKNCYAYFYVGQMGVMLFKTP
mmetsp:Transcript_132509/g.283205  ORF Transcript_132509/g.283205 Transcript_132509/m.283205 type:complete len:88 (-) Transcript_132509:383-646(-)